jgi:hypothetical protein
MTKCGTSSAAIWDSSITISPDATDAFVRHATFGDRAGVLGAIALAAAASGALISN